MHKLKTLLLLINKIGDHKYFEEITFPQEHYIKLWTQDNKFLETFDQFD